MTAFADITGYLQANWQQTPILVSDDYISFPQLPALANDPQLIVDFPGAVEEFVSIAVHLQNGYRDSGVFQLAIASPIGFEQTATRQLCEDLRNLLRAKRIGNTVVQTIDPFSAMGNQDGKWQIYLSLASYYRDAFH
jgi:hypothetical protein